MATKVGGQTRPRGGAVDGSGGSSEAAAKVVEEIKALGGEAIGNGSSVTDDGGVANMVKQAIDASGRLVDILIANAGVLRCDKSFAKMEISDFEFVMGVHLMGTVKPVKALWEISALKQNYGRIKSSPPGRPGSTATSARPQLRRRRKLSLVGFNEQPQARGPEGEQHSTRQRGRSPLSPPPG